MRIFTLCGYFALSISLMTSHSLGQDYFGAFPDELSGTFKVVDGKTLFVTSAPFQFVDSNDLDWPVPSQQGTDGASIPSVFWPFIGHPMEGNYLWAAVVHDYYWRVRTRTSDATHRAFYDGMRAKGVESWKADLMYWAVLTFGDRWTIQKQVKSQPTCTQMDDGTVVCEHATVANDVAVAEQGADLSDPEVLAVAEAKLAAIARTLKTTDGAVLDVSTFGQVLSGPDQIEQSASAYREIIASGSFRDNPEQLGLLTDWGQADIESLAAWPNSTLPTIYESPGWSEFLNEKLEGNSLPNLEQLGNQGGYTLRAGEIKSLSNDYLSNLNLRPQFLEQYQMGPVVGPQ